MGVCNCSMFCCMLLYVHSSIAIILTGKRELVALLMQIFMSFYMTGKYNSFISIKGLLNALLIQLLLIKSDVCSRRYKIFIPGVPV